MLTVKWTTVVSLLAVAAAAAVAVSAAGGAAAEAGQRSALIVYHGGTPPWRGAPPLDAQADAMTQATTQPVNAAFVAERIAEALRGRGLRVVVREATEVRGPDEFQDHDAIVFGSATWFSNVAYPLKAVFDEHLIRLYEHRQGRLGDKVLAGFVTVMEGGQSGPRALQCLTWGMEHLSARIPEGLVVNVHGGEEEARQGAAAFCERVLAALEE
jgi:hypothetical protein